MKSNRPFAAKSTSWIRNEIAFLRGFIEITDSQARRNRALRRELALRNAAR